MARRLPLIVRVVLPVNRRVAGNLEIVAASGAVTFGPVECLGLTDQTFASHHGNPTRSTAFPFGDIPLGWYRGRLSVPPRLPHLRPTTQLRNECGAGGWIALEALTGDALLARTRGAYGALILGGRLGTGDRLRPTLGGLRLRDADMVELRYEINRREIETSELLCCILEENYPAAAFAAELAEYHRFS
jgi:hypothetical protein